MSRINVTVTHTIGDLDRDLRRIPGKAATAMAKAVRTRAEQGNRHAKASARRTARTHGKHYPDSMIAESVSAFEWVYGPHPSIAQGEMSFEFGSTRNQKPHLNLANSADVIGPKLAKDMRDMFDRLFW